MSEISEAAKAKAVELAKAAGSGVRDWNGLGQFASGDALARFIQQVSNAAKEANHHAWHPVAFNAGEISDLLEPFILPEPADPLTAAAAIIQNWRNGNAGEDDALDTARLVAAALKIVETRDA